MLHESCKQEFNDWPQAFLHIGTLANSYAEDSFPFQKYTKEFKLEEVGKLQNELNMKLEDEQEENLNDLINEHSSLEPAAQEVETISDVSNIKHGNFYPGNSLIHSTGRDLCYDSKKGGIGKKSLSFLFKKMFACRKGFQPTPSFKDPLLSTDSRMEKVDKKLTMQLSLCSHTLTCSFIFILCSYFACDIIDSEGNASEKDTSPRFIFNNICKEVPGKGSNAPV